jgi:hypothetical protein
LILLVLVTEMFGYQKRTSREIPIVILTPEV